VLIKSNPLGVLTLAPHGKYMFNINDTNKIIIFKFIIVSIIVHKIFDINTILAYYLGINNKPIR
jgi:hypothetical protein